MTLSTRALKAISGVGAVAVCGVSGVLVATDPKPPAAPLRPPLSGTSSSTAALVIPPSCDGPVVGAGGSTAMLDPSLVPVLQQLHQASTPAARRAILATMTASQRLAIEAYLRALRRTAAGASATCGPETSSGGGSIAPSVVDAPPSPHALINTYVS
jgi:hypothetical protein